MTIIESTQNIKNSSFSIEQKPISVINAMITESKEQNESSKAGQRRLRAESHIQQLNQTIDSKNADEIASLILKYTKNGNSAIYHAAKANDLDAVNKLINYGGDVQQAVIGAVDGRALILLQNLIGKVKNPTIEFTTLAANIEWWEGLDYMLSKGEKTPDLNNYFTSNHKNLNIIIELVKRGAKFSPNFNAKSLYEVDLFSDALRTDPILISEWTHRRTQIFEALRSESNPPVNQVFNIPYRIRKPNSPTWIYSKMNGQNAFLKRDHFGYICTPLQFAVLNEDFDLTKALLKIGADPNIDNFSPLKCAKDRQNKALITLLIEYGAKVDGV